jgi:hypothetical protein
MGAVAAVFGENKVLRPLCSKGFFRAFQSIMFLFSISTDYIILSLRKTIFREKKVRQSGVGQISRIRMVIEGTEEAAAPVIRNFTFALLMTCLGILVILGVLLIVIIHITA